MAKILTRSTTDAGLKAECVQRRNISAGVECEVDVSIAPISSAKSRGRRLGPERLAWLDAGDRGLSYSFERLRRVLDKDISIMILGAVGTGKSTVAYAIHTASRRCDRPFLSINCAAMDGRGGGGLHLDPAFSNAAGRVGRRDVLDTIDSDGGTFFFDNVDVLTPAQQSRLLAFMDDRRRMLTGPLLCDAANTTVISSSRHELAGLIERGDFREDLYYRLNGYILRLPKLRDRSDFARLSRRVLQQLNYPGYRIERHALQRMKNYPWPGNFRQLYTVLQAAAVQAGGDQLIRLEHLPDDIQMT